MRPPLIGSLVVLALAGTWYAVGCSSEPEPPPPHECASAADCANGFSCHLGTCVPPSAPVDAGRDAGSDAGMEDAGLDGGMDAGADAGDGGLADAGEDGGLDAGMADAGFCVGDAGNPPNLLPNPGFECGNPPGAWLETNGAVLTADTSGPHSGMQAASLSSGTLTGSVSLFPATPPVDMPGVAHFCARAWVRSQAVGTVRLSIQRYQTGGGLQEASFSAPLTPSWQSLKIDAVSTALDQSVTLRVWTPAPLVGAPLLVDDAELWVSPSGTCTER